MDDDIRGLLGLQGYGVGGIMWGEDGDRVTVELPTEEACPHCGQLTARVHQRSKKASRLLWGFVGQRRLWVEVHRQRLWCAGCRRAFAQSLPGMVKRQRVTMAAQVAVLGALAEQNFASVERSWGVSYGRARRMLLRLPVLWCDWGVLVGEERPIKLGIDEHSFRGKGLVITITCLSTHQVLAILPDDRQATLRALRACRQQ
ncbi:MAG: transposase [Chloroflexi bacterium]|nr:transposase [Chloroflexota bacterium]